MLKLERKIERERPKKIRINRIENYMKIASVSKWDVGDRAIWRLEVEDKGGTYNIIVGSEGWRIKRRYYYLLLIYFSINNTVSY